MVAQNQAAVAGASMLNIRHNFRDYANENTSSAMGLEPTALQGTPILCFSVVTAGRMHEVFAHFMHKGGFHMRCIRSCRRTDPRDAQEFVHFLFRIIQWGRGSFKDGIVEDLEKLLRRDCHHGRA